MSKDVVEWKCEYCKESPDILRRCYIKEGDMMFKKFLCEKCVQNIFKEQRLKMGGN